MLIGPTFFAAMEMMQHQEPGVRFVMPAATPTLREMLQPLVDAHPGLALTITDGQSQLAMTAADAILVKSGTVTLEAALLKKPMVISYKVPWLTGQIMQRSGLSAVRGSAEHSGRPFRRAGNPAAFRDARGAGRSHAETVERRSQPAHADGNLHGDASRAEAEYRAAGSGSRGERASKRARRGRDRCAYLGAKRAVRRRRSA